MWKSKFEMVLVLIYSKQRTQDFIDYISDLREYDVPYHIRFAIDKGYISNWLNSYFILDLV